MADLGGFFFGGNRGNDDSGRMNAPLGGLPNASPMQMPVYSNLHNQILQNQQQELSYVLPEGGKHKRGKFEKAFSQIGAMIFAGSGIGLVNGLRASGISKAQWNSAYMTQAANHIGKNCASSAQAFGTAAFLYSACETSLELMGCPNDEVNTMISAPLAGVIYKSTAGLKGIRVGAITGFVAGGMYCLGSRLYHNYTY